MSRMIKHAVQCLQSRKKIISRPFPMPINNTSAPKLSCNSEETFIIGRNHRAMRNDIFIFGRRHFCTTQAAAKPASLEFTVRRCKPQLVAPAEHTPRELKPLSDIDDQNTLRFFFPIIKFYRCDPSMKGKDPARVIREALAKALVFYYPFAGRLREGPARKLSVDCTGEGILFLEADADVELTQFGDPPQPPFPSFEQLFDDVHGTWEGIVNGPLLLIQVTRLKCGGFVVGLRFNHTMCDGLGLVQFLSAVGEIARGAHVPSTIPTWNREIFSARDPPRVTCTHNEFENTNDPPTFQLNDQDIIHRFFYFGSLELQAIRKYVPQHLQPRPTSFEVLTACLWRCHTIALQLNSNDDTRLLFTVNSRNKMNSAFPIGYYGNAFGVPAAVTEAGKLTQGSLEYAIGLVKKAKEEINEEYMQSLADLMVVRDRPFYNTVRSLIVTDMRRIGCGDVDFGWGKAAYAGPGRVEIPGIMVMVAFRNHKGEDGIMVQLCLPAEAMERFEREVTKMLSDQST